MVLICQKGHAGMDCNSDELCCAVKGSIFYAMSAYMLVYN
jgi:hypothetical protein